MKVLGIDPDFTGTGLVVINESGKVEYTELIETSSSESTINRVGQIMGRIWVLIDRLKENNEHVWISIEGMAFNARGRAVFDLGYLGYRLREEFIRYIEVEPTPNQLKKFCLDKGQGKKNLILQQVYKRWGEEFQDDNIADAYVLARIGLAYLDTEKYGPMTAFQAEVINQLKGIKPSKKTKKAKKQRAVMDE
jgi:crossover junction endodeoxyribonuclease RuvC